MHYLYSSFSIRSGSAAERDMTHRTVSTTSRTSAGIAYNRAGPHGDLPVVLLHAGVADRRM